MSRQIHDLLRARFPAKTHALLFEVRNAAGYSADRSCDAMAMGLWPSRGLKLAGFEIKESRADWLKEYREPEKAEAFSVFCDEWWVVAGDSSIVQMDELPEAWGLLVAKGKRLECVKPAPKIPTPEPIDRNLLATLLKRAIDQERTPAQEEFQRGVDHGRKSEREATLARAGTTAEELQRLKKVVYDFERASGVSLLYERDGEKLGNAVRTVLNGGHTVLQQPITNMLHQARDLVQRLEHMAETVKQ